MARLTPLDREAATGVTKELLDRVNSDLGAPVNMTCTMANSSAALRGYVGFRDALSGGVLSPQLREKIALTVAESNRCRYCVSAHTFAGRLIGLDDTDIVDARSVDSSDPKAEVALQFAQTLVEYRADITDAELEIVRRAGYTDEQIIEIVANVALNIYTNYVNEVAQTEVDFPAAAFDDNYVA